MRFVRFLRPDGTTGVGVVDGDAVHVVDGVDDLLPLLVDAALPEVGRRALSRGDNVAPLAGLRCLSPVATPPTVRDFYAFEAHVRAGRASRGLDMDPEWYERPVFYFSSPYAVTGEGEVPVPPGCLELDFELEVAAVLGGGGRDLTPAEGAALVAGFCVMNDWSARDVQRREMRLSLGPVKSKDTATALGPWLVTPDELEDARDGNGYRLAMTCTVNGRRTTESTWADVYWSFGEMVAYASRGSEVRPGDVFGSGTCANGCLLELRQREAGAYPWLVPGDRVVASVERLGDLRNVVVPGRPAVALRPSLDAGHPPS
jgi:2-keto-4-pentenoate hydratase/2-oxohepta-3-ene-1,7-dioic acid hydratase in catechol pathway